MEAPKAIEPLGGTVEDQGTTVEGPPNIPHALATTGIFRPGGCASATWRYATPHKSAEYADTDPHSLLNQDDVITNLHF